MVEGDAAAGELALSRSRDAICVAIGGGGDGGVCVAAFGNLKVIYLPSRRRLSERDGKKKKKRRRRRRGCSDVVGGEAGGGRKSRGEFQGARKH